MKEQSYYFVMLGSNTVPLAMFLHIQSAVNWKDQWYPSAIIERFELQLDFEDEPTFN